MALQPRLRRDVLEGEVEDASRGEQHDRAQDGLLIRQPEPAHRPAHRPHQREQQHPAHRDAAGDVPGQLPPRVEALGKVLQADQQRQQDGAVGAGREHAAERQRFRQKVGPHRDELRRRAVALRLDAVHRHEGRAAGKQQRRGHHRMRQASGPLRDQHQGDGSHQHPAAEGDHEVLELLLQPARPDVPDRAQTGAHRYAGAGQRRPQQQLG